MQYCAKPAAAAAAVHRAAAARAGLVGEVWAVGERCVRRMRSRGQSAQSWTGHGWIAAVSGEEAIP